MRNVFLLALLTACSTSKAKNSASSGGSTAGAAQPINGYVLGLPGWPALSANANGPTGSLPTNATSTGTDNIKYDCASSSILVYSLSGTPVSTTGFAATNPMDIAYDESRDRLYVADGTSNKAISFDPQANHLAEATLPGTVSAVAYDATNNHVLVSDWGSNSVNIFNADDLSEAPFVDGQFSTSIAVRP